MSKFEKIFERASKNPYPRLLGKTEKERMTNLWMDTCNMFVPYSEYGNLKIPKNEIGRMFGCRILFKE